ncbi:MAG: hypothetical protein AB1483_12250 [Candidatus Zixiibacteriota bacterium]
MTQFRKYIIHITVSIWVLGIVSGCGDNPVVSDQVTWYTNVGTEGMDYATDIAAANDGGFVIVGRTDNYPAILRDAFVAKVDGSGDVVWQRLIGGNYYDWANAVTATSDGGFVAVGHSQTSDTAVGDTYIFKVDNEGNLIWENRIAGDGFDEAVDVVETADGGFVATGNCDAGTTRSILLFKVDSDGKLVWQKSLGNSDYAWANAIALAPDNDLMLIGHSASTWDYAQQYYVLRVNSTGELIYEKLINTETGLGCFDIASTGDGGFVILGRSRYFDQTTYEEFRDIYLMKIDAAANVLWDEVIDVGDDDLCGKVSVLSDGGLALVGTTDDYSDGLPRYTHVIRTSGNGTVLWKQSFALDNRIYGEAVVPCSDGGMTIAGSVYLPESGYDAFVMKIDANGILFRE